MPYYFAKFYKKNELLLRVDTRIYFGSKKPNSREGNCLGLVILKNPGSANPTNIGEWSEIQIGNDKALPWIANVYSTVLKELNLVIDENSYLRVCNLLPIREPNIDLAIKSLKENNYSAEDIEYKVLPFIFFAWGWETELNPFRADYLYRLSKFRDTSFFVKYDHRNNENKFQIIDGLPQIGDKVKHTQGMPQNIIIDKIKNILLKNQSEIKSRLL
ncbi:MAG: hypothetical protein Kow0068_24650 [Marinilabiliales bacterium]